MAASKEFGMSKWAVDALCQQNVYEEGRQLICGVMNTASVHIENDL